jgi:hypothetical protein
MPMPTTAISTLYGASRSIAKRIISTTNEAAIPIANPTAGAASMARRQRAGPVQARHRNHREERDSAAKGVEDDHLGEGTAWRWAMPPDELAV